MYKYMRRTKCKLNISKKIFELLTWASLMTYFIISFQFLSTVWKSRPSSGICCIISSELNIGSKYSHCAWTFSHSSKVSWILSRRSSHSCSKPIYRLEWVNTEPKRGVTISSSFKLLSYYRGFPSQPLFYFLGGGIKRFCILLIDHKGLSFVDKAQFVRRKCHVEKGVLHIG